ncbi:hypothetical protein NZD85_09790 [Empedobacter stercoris]|uniref:hypothetical protein n=1 Tax=Empedobacter stercoris TaxID=1628248 RepID=UPI0021AFF598|nr:hypothetical protein [Empedobacter stercoris]UWX66185.1 hypothetical protein NZD85_09790 [Empedobacter stercoris]
MNKQTLPTDELKKYGIINDDNSFSKKLSADDVQVFLNGGTIVADNETKRITFHLTENNSKLNVNLFERDKSLKDVLENSKNNIEYTEITNISTNGERINFEQKAFVYDEKSNQTLELDVIKDIKEISEIVKSKNNDLQTNRYKIELQKLQSFLQDKIDKFPEIAKDILVDLNIVSNEINSINSISNPKKQQQKQNKSDINLNVNDPDMYQDASLKREEEMKEEENQTRRRGR